MRTIIFIFFLLFTFFLRAQQSIPPIGLWRDHLPYSSAIDITGGADRIYCATPYTVFAVNTTDQSIERMSRVTGLSETGISAVYFEAVNEKLFIAYSNSNIDIIYRNDIINIPDIKRDNIIGDKAINGIYSLHNDFYLSAGLGVIVIDGERYEVKDTWLIGNAGAQVKVNGMTSDGNFFYAATAEGLKRAPINSPGLADYNNWQLLSGSDGLPAGNCQSALRVQDKVVAQKDDSLFLLQGSGWTLLYTDGWQIIDATVSENRINLCQRRPNGDARVTILNSDGSVLYSLVQPAAINFPRKAFFQAGDIWIADQAKGLSLFDTQGTFEHIIPNSPQGTANGEMVVKDQVLYVSSGGADENWNRQNNPKGIYILKEGIWTNLNHEMYPQLDTVKDLLAVAVDPVDKSIWAGSYGDGLLRVKDGATFEIFKQNVLGPDLNDPGSYKVTGLAFDAANNLWISNYGADQPLIAQSPGGSFAKFTPGLIVNENALTQVLVDDNNYKWVIASKGGGLLCFDHGTSIENTGDDRWRRFTPGSGSGNLPGAEVLSIAKDKNGFIWVGTDNGVAVIQCPQESFAGSACDAVWPVVQEGNFAGYLFKGEQVKSIAVDGADRKWIATKKGAWLIGSTGEEVIYQFTEENSPLLSNDVNKIAIDGNTGEVFFSTAKGICSFRSTATEGTAKNENVLVFPNPVPPGYSGTIGIRGLANNAIVKITEMNGRLVYQTRALGGQATWNGRDYKGRKISTGVYLVLVNNDERTEKAAARIVFVNN